MGSKRGQTAGLVLALPLTSHVNSGTLAEPMTFRFFMCEASLLGPDLWDLRVYGMHVANSAVSGKY